MTRPPLRALVVEAAELDGQATVDLLVELQDLELDNVLVCRPDLEDVPDGGRWTERRLALPEVDYAQLLPPPMRAES
jgi:hypothetical protein